MTDTPIIIGITAIVLLSFVFGLLALWYANKRQRAEHYELIKEQYRAELEFASRLAGEQLHQNVLNRQIRPIFKSLREFRDKLNAPNSKIVEDIIEQLEKVEDRIRHVSNEIYPPHLSESFVHTCQHEARNLAHRHKYEGSLEFDFVGDFDSLDELLKFGLYSLIDLFVSNSLNHAQPTKINVSLHLENKMLSLLMDDNGKGFDMKQAVRMDSRGMGDFRSRAISIAISAQNYDYYSIEGKGTFFEMKIKL